MIKIHNVSHSKFRKLPGTIRDTKLPRAFKCNAANLNFVEPVPVEEKTKKQDNLIKLSGIYPSNDWTRGVIMFSNDLLSLQDYV